MAQTEKEAAAQFAQTVNSEAAEQEKAAQEAIEAAAKNPDVTAAFDALFGDEDGAGEAEEPVETEAVQEETPPEPEQKADTEPSLPVRQPTKQTTSTQESTEADTDIDPGLLAAAQLSGMDPEAIKTLYSADPEGTTKALSRLSAALDSSTQQMLTYGAFQPKSDTPSREDTPAASMTPELDKIVAKADELGDVMGPEFGSLLTALKKEVIEPLSHMREATAAAEQAALAREVTTIMDGFSGSFPSFYGDTSKGLSDGQVANRQRLVNLADQIDAGATVMGQPIPAAEALQRAHRMLTADLQMESARESIVSSLTKRSKQRVSRPNSTQMAPPASPQSEEAAMEAYRRKASEIGFDISGM